jgi:hypothetical protein
MPCPAIDTVLPSAPSHALSSNDLTPIVTGLISPASTTVLSGVSTTQFALHLAHAVASGEAFLEFQVPSPASVTYVGERLARDDLRHRLTPFAWYFGEPKAELCFYSAKGTLIDTKDLRHLVARHRPRLLILDSLLLQIDAAGLSREFGCAVLQIHPCRTDADTIATLAEEEDSSDYPTFTLRVRTNGREEPFKIRRLGTLFRCPS